MTKAGSRLEAVVEGSRTMAKFTAKISQAIPQGSKPCPVKIENSKEAPESIRGKTVAGKAEWHGYKGIVTNEAGAEVWLGPIHIAPNQFGTVAVGGKTYNGSTVPPEGKTTAEAKNAALLDAVNQVSKLNGAVPGQKKSVTHRGLGYGGKDGTRCPHCDALLNSGGQCPECTGGLVMVES